MGIFSRFRDIVSSNINAMLDKAEDPDKLIRLMIQEMEETLIELKASCAKAMADHARTARALEGASAKAALWNDKATLAVSKGREDLAREALIERRRFDEKADSLREDLAEYEGAVDGCRDDIAKLEEKLISAKERRRSLALRHRRAGGRLRAREEMRRVQSEDTLIRFEQFESRIERMEAEAELAGPYERTGRGDTLEERFAGLEADEDIEKELAELKARAAKTPTASEAPAESAAPSAAGEKAPKAPAAKK